MSDRFDMMLERKLETKPDEGDGAIRLSPSQLATLLEGLDWSRIEAREVARPSAAS